LTRTGLLMKGPKLTSNSTQRKIEGDTHFECKKVEESQDARQ